MSMRLALTPLSKGSCQDSAKHSDSKARSVNRRMEETVLSIRI